MSHGATEAPDHTWSRFSIRAGTLATLLVGTAVTTSTIVFSEPAVADAMMMAVIIAVPLLGAARFGAVSLLNFAAWLGVVAFGIAATGASATFDTALKHQLVTLFLAVGSLVMAGYISADPVKRFELVMWCYVAACLLATAAALVGYFRLAPAAYELFTNYGRARGTFKDPNVYGAALVPALTFVAWNMLREPASRAALAACIGLPLTIGLLLSFSRGAWLAAVLALALLGWITFVRSRRRSDFRRFAIVSLSGTVALLAALAAALQVDEVRALVEERASLGQSYDVGPEGRFGGQEKARRLMLDNPLGIGTHTFRDTHHHEEPHNVYLSMFLNAGWIGGLLYIVSVSATVLIGLWLAMRTGVLQGPLVVAGSAFTALAFEGVVIDSDHWRHFFLLMACIWGLADAGKPIVDPSRRRTDRSG